MFRIFWFQQKAAWIPGILVLCIVPGAALAQAPSQPVTRQGEITGSDVYVRSGSSVNHYPVAKLSVGDRVTVVGETGDWYRILPTEGTFSLISGDYVDTSDNRTGVVNGNNVRVRAASRLPEFSKLKYVVQTKLSKGAKVTIVGREPDGFLRIIPPDGVTVWVNRNYVEFVRGAPVTPEPASRTQAQEKPGKVGTSTETAAESRSNVLESGSREAATSAFTPLPKTAQRRTLQELDGLAREELDKPAVERAFGALIERYEDVAQQEEDEFARRYAEARVEQLTNMAALIETIQMIERLDQEVESERRQFLEGRASIRESLPAIPTGLDARGVLRVSALYPPGSFPERYRLVDAAGSREHTIGYVEIRPDSAIEADALLGRYVGVRASAKRLQAGGVEPVPIYVVDELVLLER